MLQSRCIRDITQQATHALCLLGDAPTAPVGCHLLQVLLHCEAVIAVMIIISPGTGQSTKPQFYSCTTPSKPSSNASAFTSLTPHDQANQPTQCISRDSRCSCTTGRAFICHTLSRSSLSCCCSGRQSWKFSASAAALMARSSACTTATPDTATFTLDYATKSKGNRHHLSRQQTSSTMQV